MAEKYKVIISDRAKSMLGVHIRFMARVDKKAAKEKEPNPEAEAILMDLAERLKTHLGTKVSIKPAGGNGGKIEIDYYSYEELDRLFDLLTSDIKY